jgi:hypothetical protein
VIWVYAIAERPDVPPPSAAGLAGAPLATVREGALLAVLSHHADPPVVSEVEALWTHENVVERLMAQRAVLPVRFGSQLDDVAGLRRAIAGHHDELLTALDGVRGRVELAVRAVSPGPADVALAPVEETVTTEDTGHRYVRAKLELRNRAEAAGLALHARLSALAVAERRRPGRDPRELLRASYLVERPTVAEFQALAERLARERPDAALLCTGPWPPYSFVNVGIAR